MRGLYLTINSCYLYHLLLEKQFIVCLLFELEVWNVISLHTFHSYFLCCKFLNVSLFFFFPYQMVGIYLSRTLIGDIEKVKLSSEHWGLSWMRGQVELLLRSLKWMRRTTLRPWDWARLASNTLILTISICALFMNVEEGWRHHQGVVWLLSGFGVTMHSYFLHHVGFLDSFTNETCWHQGFHSQTFTLNCVHNCLLFLWKHLYIFFQSNFSPVFCLILRQNHKTVWIFSIFGCSGNLNISLQASLIN